jgi:hypothetical protein
LVHHIPELLPRINKAIHDEPEIARKSLKEQFDYKGEADSEP